MRIVFMGTPEFGVPSLHKLAEAGFAVVAVVTQPDRPVGRSGRPRPSPVKRAALELGIPVLQPETVRDDAFVEELRSLAPDVVVVAAYGQILTRKLLAVPPRGFVNVHAAMLPRYRGAAPIAAAILAGEKEAGVTIMGVLPKLDTGPIIAQEAVPILADDTTATLSKRMAEAGAKLLVKVLPRYVSGELEPRPQDEALATYIPMITKEQGHVDWTRPADEIARRCRAFHPWPGCYCYWNERLVKLLAVRPLPEAWPDARPGEVRGGPDGAPLVVAAGDGAVAVDRLQLEGKRAVSAAEFLRGQPGIIGQVLR